jgi:predicted membrane protein DUF2231
LFTTILGIPAHPLLIHAAVVFVPLLIAAAIVYAIWPAARSRLDWALAGLAIAAPLAVWFAKVSGQNFRQRLINRKLASPLTLAHISQHQSYGTKTLWWTIALAVVSLAMLYYDRRIRKGAFNDVVWVIGTVVTIVLGGFTGYYVFRTGDTGAHIVWTGF